MDMTNIGSYRDHVFLCEEPSFVLEGVAGAGSQMFVLMRWVLDFGDGAMLVCIKRS